MTDEKVVDFRTRRPYAIAKAEENKAKRKARSKVRKQESDNKAAHREALLEVLGSTIKLVEEGRLEGLVILSREVTTKLFYTDVVLDDRVIPLNDLHAFVGCLETLKIELADGAAMAPALLGDGSTIDPGQDAGGDWEEYE
ncbi:hypothetical protein [Pararhizobium qamdonense]|uniref:hypothetical protein n=1 Tax=Pararhizobium qamdonense TaxID=3031126 RepID=UPI0023E1D3D0|nr:hypothetical protein [Pararhizobium qamdonense]